MPTTVTDYHELIRDAMKTAIEAAIPELDWQTIDAPEDVMRLTLPCAAVCCVGPEQDRPEMSTNVKDGLGYSVAVILLSTGTSRGEKITSHPNLTSFRRIVRNTFNNKRLSGVTQVGWCEVQDSGELFDEKANYFQRVSTALVVTAVGRFPRS